ncbi:maleylpyruvate isomerase family mycothiol-dependent enzyme [Cryptosporangium minutisporangium]|uniref:Maleylpyruvate isomerase family mycothiol-dependent enzyme n=1 Tax=Cryptosporangium minutisporangium TaxID=113569 RepID=A0ABP6SNZ5_9ACTN
MTPTQYATVLPSEQIAAAVRTERLRLCDYLDRLDDAAWAVQSLCSEWTVREVVAHLTTTTRTTVFTVLKGAIKARGSFHRMEADTAHDRAARFSPAQLVAQLRESAESSRRTPFSSAMDPLMDILVHGQDIARPVGRSHPMRVEVTLPALAYVATNRFLGGPARIAGLRLSTTDANWSTGDGPVVRGTAENLLLAAAGRAAGLAFLEGPGVDRLTDRLAAG